MHIYLLTLMSSLTLSYKPKNRMHDWTNIHIILNMYYMYKYKVYHTRYVQIWIPCPYVHTSHLVWCKEGLFMTQRSLNVWRINHVQCHNICVWDRKSTGCACAKNCLFFQLRKYIYRVTRWYFVGSIWAKF